MGLEALNEVTIFNFSGSDCELSYILYVLSQATELDTLNIYCVIQFFDDPIGVYKRASIRVYGATASNNVQIRFIKGAYPRIRGE